VRFGASGELFCQNNVDSAAYSRIGSYAPEHTLCIYFVIIIIITFLYISESINVFIYLVTYRPIRPGALCVFVYVIVYKYVNVCTSHNNKPFTYSPV